MKSREANQAIKIIYKGFKLILTVFIDYIFSGSHPVAISDNYVFYFKRNIPTALCKASDLGSALPAINRNLMLKKANYKEEQQYEQFIREPD